MNKEFFPLEEDAHFLLAKAAKYHKLFASKLEDLTRVRDKEESVFKTDADLAIEPDLENDQIVFRYANTQVRFRLIVGNDGGAPRGRVVCTHEYERLGKIQAHSLGEFLIDERGVTNFIDERGRPYYSHSGGDMIVAHFLAAAFRHNMEI